MHSLVVSVNPKKISDIIDVSCLNPLKKKLNALFLSYWLRGCSAFILLILKLTDFFNSL